MSDAAPESPAIDALRFPAGRFTADPHADMAAMIDRIAATPDALDAIAATLTPDQWAQPYRPGGWTAAQVVHHLADSHVNAYIRTRFALAEDGFTVKPYDENRWAQFPDATATSVAAIATSLMLLKGLHARWTSLLRTLGPTDFQRPLLHPERGPMTLHTLVQLYAWHGVHHAGHLKISRSQVSR
jgi:uncharacterized damage-inducible protein DinB